MIVRPLYGGTELSCPAHARLTIPQFSAMMAEVLLVRGDVDGAESWLKNAIEFERTRDDLYFTSEVHRLSARCLVRRDRLDEACAQLRVAIDLARAQGAATFELRATLNLADINPREGATAVREAFEKLPEPEPWPDVDAARALVNLSA